MADLLDGVLDALRSRRIALDAERTRLDAAIAAFEALPPPASAQPTAAPATKAKPNTKRRAGRKTPAARDRLILQTVLAAGPDGISFEAIRSAHPSLTRDATQAAIKRLVSSADVQKSGATRSMRYYVENPIHF